MRYHIFVFLFWVISLMACNPSSTPPTTRVSTPLEVDPTALVSVGFFHPQKPNPARIGDLRLAVTEPAIWQSTLDFVDLHPYPGIELNLKQYVENYGIKGMQEKPIIMGEFGAARSAYATEAGAARALHDW